MSLRGTVLAAFWLLATTTTVYGSPVGDCPPVDPLDHTDHLPDDYNCTLFYKCDHAAPVLFVCPDGLHFNRKLEVCDWPDNAGCTGITGDASTASTSSSMSTAVTSSTGKSSTAPPSSPATSAPAGDCPAVGVCPQYEDEKSIAKHLPHATNCSQFCKCDHGKPVTFDCPAGLHFNAALEVCDWPANAGCTGGNGSSTAAPSSTAKPTTAAPTSPSKPSSAAPPSSASPSTAAPSSPASPSTAAPSSPASSDPSGECPAVGVCPQDEDEKSIAKHLPHATNCSQFCKCDHGKPVTFDCPAGLHFNAALEVCDWPANAGCTGGNGASTAAPSSTEKPTTEAPNASPNTSSPAPTSTATPSSAAPSSPSSPATPSPTSGPGSSSEKPADTEPCDAVGSCPLYDQDSVVKHLPHRTDCGLYCRCNHGVPITEKCPDGLHFNAKLEVCDWPADAGCTQN